MRKPPRIKNVYDILGCAILIIVLCNTDLNFSFYSHSPAVRFKYLTFHTCSLVSNHVVLTIGIGHLRKDPSCFIAGFTEGTFQCRLCIKKKRNKTNTKTKQNKKIKQSAQSVMRRVIINEINFKNHD